MCQGAYTENVSLSPKNYEMALLFAALADRTRLRLLNLMQGKEVCVCYLVEILGQSKPKISRHLAYLRKAGVVAARREGKWMHYRIERPENPAAESVLEAVFESFKSDREMQSDLSRLTRACCEPERFVALQGVPIPIQSEAAPV